MHVVKFNRGSHEISLNKFIKTEIKKKKYWSGLPFPPPGDLSDPGNKPTSPGFSSLTGRFFSTEPPGKPLKLDEN